MSIGSRWLVAPVLTAALACAGFAFVAPVPAGAVPSLGAVATTSPVVFTCAASYVSKPKSYTTTCADGYTYFSALVWSAWGGKTATASGTFHMNPCTPNCAASKVVAYPSTVHLSRLKTVGRRRVYSSLSATYTVRGVKKPYTFVLSVKR